MAYSTVSGCDACEGATPGFDGGSTHFDSSTGRIFLTCSFRARSTDRPGDESCVGGPRLRECPRRGPPRSRLNRSARNPRTASPASRLATSARSSPSGNAASSSRPACNRSPSATPSCSCQQSRGCLAAGPAREHLARTREALCGEPPVYGCPSRASLRAQVGMTTTSIGKYCGAPPSGGGPPITSPTAGPSFSSMKRSNASRVSQMSYT